MLVDAVHVAAGRVGLPDLDQRVADRPAVAVDHPARDDDALAERLARVLPGEVVSRAPTAPAPKTGPVVSASGAGSMSSGRAGARRRVER